MFCRQCGQKLKDGDRFCPVCGTESGWARMQQPNSPGPDIRRQNQQSNVQSGNSPQLNAGNRSDRSQDAGQQNMQRQNSRRPDPQQNPAGRSDRRPDSQRAASYSGQSSQQEYTGYGPGPDKKQKGSLAAVLSIAAVVIICCSIFAVLWLMKKPDQAVSAESGSAGAAYGAETAGNNEAEKKEEKTEEADKEKTEEEEDTEDEDPWEDEEESEGLMFDGARRLTDASEADLTPYKKLSVTDASATSTIYQKNTDNGPMRLFDGREDTSWQEGVDGYGIGEQVSARFDKNHQIKYIAFKLGNWRNESYFNANSVPAAMTIRLGDFETEVTFTGEMKEEWIELTEPVNADRMTLTIDDVYEGAQWDDTCITCITVYGK